MEDKANLPGHRCNLILFKVWHSPLASWQLNVALICQRICDGVPLPACCAEGSRQFKQQTYTFQVLNLKVMCFSIFLPIFLSLLVWCFYLAPLWNFIWKSSVKAWFAANYLVLLLLNCLNLRFLEWACPFNNRKVDEHEISCCALLCISSIKQ